MEREKLSSMCEVLYLLNNRWNDKSESSMILSVSVHGFGPPPLWQLSIAIVLLINTSLVVYTTNSRGSWQLVEHIWFFDWLKLLYSPRSQELDSTRHDTWNGDSVHRWRESGTPTLECFVTPHNEKANPPPNGANGA